jgi:hypothetical protein
MKTRYNPFRLFTRQDPCAGANVYAAEYTNSYVTTPPVKNSAAQLGGRIRIFRATYTQGASVGAVGDIVYFGKLPQGATPVPGGKAFFSTGTASSTLKIGLTGSDACFAAATAITTAGTFTLDVFAASGAVLKNSGTTDLEIIGTVAGAGIAAAQVITVWQPYVMND